MPVLLIIRHEIDNAWISRVWVPCAFLLLRVEVGIRGTDNVGQVSRQELHRWLILRVPRSISIRVSFVVNIETAIHELDVTFEVVLERCLIEAIAKKLGI